MIVNKPSLTENDMVQQVRAAIYHRASWCYFLVDEARKRGLDWQFAYDAVYRCGCWHRSLKHDNGNLKEYAQEVFCNDGVMYFEQVLDIRDDEVIVDFHFEPLVKAWQDMTDDEELIDRLFDIAMAGDFGLFSNPKYKFEVLKRITRGDAVGKIRITYAE